MSAAWQNYSFSSVSYPVQSWRPQEVCLIVLFKYPLSYSVDNVDACATCYCDVCFCPDQSKRKAEWPKPLKIASRCNMILGRNILWYKKKSFSLQSNVHVWPKIVSDVPVARWSNSCLLWSVLPCLYTFCPLSP